MTRQHELAAAILAGAAREADAKELARLVVASERRREARSRKALAATEARIAEQVAHGGDAGESDVLDAVETEAAAAGLLARLGKVA